ncbi:hypothetical protein K504DRAFT_383608 [Pleomassaria siparia CBS 279.74]|uniref:HMG box domain-containing protein n=1 Tax=Pleomassaria siparia CBS 279.74 TaxID=1314801 RepID=A0A6G1K519_9PLEO|nr:hypothetical protein K504DRAFT_383608 [Pleomassaria siparia CBS 279.74]
MGTITYLLPLQTGAPVLSNVLERLGLSRYLRDLNAHGFHDWETVIDITEGDMSTMQFKLGHRRALQREIATYRGVPSSLPLEMSESTPADHASPSTSVTESFTRETPTPNGEETTRKTEKRRYRRHPRPDNNAPKKPKTAYVNFADQLRAEPEISALSFVDIAKEVGRRWQVLPAEKKRIWESHAVRSLQEYEIQLDEYRQTDSWHKYQAYLHDFKAHQAHSSPTKRPAAPSRAISFGARTAEDSLASLSSNDSPLSGHSSSSSSGFETGNCQNMLTYAFNELVSLRGDTLAKDVQLYDAQHLPDEGLVHRAMHAFVRCTGSLLFILTYSQVDEIIDRIYRPENPADPLTLAECFTIAALGVHYDSECFSDHIQRVLYASGMLHFNEQTALVNYFRTMRLLLLLSFYALSEQHLSARHLVAAGLQIARWQCPPLHQSKNDATAESWRQIFRSLVFMDCWLSYTLGYTADVTANDISIVCTLPHPERATTDELIHTQSSRIGLIAGEIVKQLASPELVTRECIDMLTAKLETWRMEVPSMLQIPIITSDNPSDLTCFQRGAILLVHIMYFGALILLYRPLLVTSAETKLGEDAAWNLELSPDETRRCRNECAVAAQQIARILSVMSFDGTFSQRCWIIIYWSFTACVALLFSATTKLLDGFPETVNDDLNFAKACMDVLEPCKRIEPMADGYLAIVWPLYDHLRDIHQRTLRRFKTSIFSLLQADANTLSPPIPVSSEEMRPISEKLAILLTNPFCREQGGGISDGGRELLNQDGSCEFLWWK